MSLARFTTSVADGTTRRSPVVVGLLVVSVLVLAVTLVWTFLGMRAVMDVGGSCAEGGPYEIATPCPNGAVLLSVAIPVMILSAMLGSGMALLVRAPNLLLPMWTALFGSLGWNFLEYGFTTDDGLVWGWIVCGVVFELMALPAVGMIVAGSQLAGLVPRAPVDAVPDTGRSSPLTWWLGYLALAVAGVLLGAWSFDALS
jgi:hypothetical protein